MKSPYMLAVKGISQAIGGEFPAHYDSVIRRRVRLLFIFSTVLLGVLVVTRGVSSGGSFRLPSEPDAVVILVFGIVVSLITLRLAKQRRRSIEKHVLETDTDQVVTDDTAETAADVSTIFDYLKVFFVLALLYRVPRAIFILRPDLKIFLQIDVVTLIIQLYYLLIVLNLFIPLMIRWGSQYITNDADSQPEISSSQR